MGVEVHLLLVATLGKYGRRRIDTICRTVLCPVAVGIASGRVSRVLACSRVEQHLSVEDIVVLVCRSEHTEVADETFVESMLRDVNLCHKIVVVLGLYDGVMVDITERRTIVRLFRATAESQIMVLNKACSSDYVIEVVFVSAIVGVYPEVFGSSKIFVSRQHVEFLRHGFQSDVCLVRYLEPFACAPLCLHLDNARRTARAVEGGLGGILKHRETLYIGRIDCRERGDIACHAVDDDERVVASDYRRGSAHSHRRELRHTVHAVRSNVNTGCIAVQHVEGIVHDTFVLYLQVCGNRVALHVQLLHLSSGRCRYLQRDYCRCKYVLV